MCLTSPWRRESCPFQAASKQPRILRPARDKQMLNTGRRAAAWLMKGHVDPIANQYVPNMQCPLWLVMKKQASWFIIMMPWEAEGRHRKHCCGTIKPWTCGKLTSKRHSPFISALVWSISINQKKMIQRVFCLRQDVVRHVRGRHSTEAVWGTCESRVRLRRMVLEEDKGKQKSIKQRLQCGKVSRSRERNANKWTNR